MTKTNLKLKWYVLPHPILSYHLIHYRAVIKYNKMMKEARATINYGIILDADVT